MDMNVYVVGMIAEARLNEARAERARLALLESLEADRPGVVERAGAAFSRFGRWLHRITHLDPVSPRGQYRVR
jgi:hypothetical protein